MDADPGAGFGEPITTSVPSSQFQDPVPSDGALDEAMRAQLPEKLNKAIESADPVAGLDSAISAVADELSRGRDAERPIVPGQRGEIDSAIEALVGTALQMDDPVKGLEEGAESLAEALAERDTAAREHLRAAHERQIDEQAAYRHARFHRVTELLDVGYSLDQAVAIANANETEIRVRAAVSGRNPMEPIYQYAVLNGYRPAPPKRSSRPEASHLASRDSASNASPTLEALAGLDEAAFTDVTRGDRWQALMRD
jgi:hypothetical protein